jgi:hypothetical protein
MGSIDHLLFTERVQLRRDLLELSESLGDSVAFNSVSVQPSSDVRSRVRSVESFL